MAKIHFVDHNGETRTIDVENGATVMEAAIRNAIPGIEAECGGACACATCHVYVDEAWREKVGAPSPMEEDMLDFGFDVRPNSRLSCQIKVSDALDGLVVVDAGTAGLSSREPMSRLRRASSRRSATKPALEIRDDLGGQRRRFARASRRSAPSPIAPTPRICLPKTPPDRMSRMSGRIW